MFQALAAVQTSAQRPARPHAPSTLTAMKSWPSHRIAGLDLIRALAIGLVLVRHAWPERIGGAGLVGVGVFFALSGWLITGLLLRDIHRLGRIDYRRFYRHRAVRLLPALVLVLIGFVVVTLTVDPFDEASTIPRTLLVGLTYTGDVPHLDTGSLAMTHLWSVSIEEQFYLVWPLVLLIGVRLRRLTLAALACMALTLALCVGSLFAVDAPYLIYTWPTSWALLMLIGALAQIHRAPLERLLPSAGAARALLSTAALALIVAFSLIPDAKNRADSYLLVGPAVAVCTVVLIVHLQHWRRPPANLLGRAALALGTVSYAAYLWNYPIAQWLHVSLGDSDLTGPLAIVLTLVAATASWHLVEAPISRWRDRRDGRAASGTGALRKLENRAELVTGDADPATHDLERAD